MNEGKNFLTYFGIGKVTVRGIYFQGNNYTCNRAISGRWFELADEIGIWPVVVFYNPRKTDFISIVCHGENVSTLCSLIANEGEGHKKLSKYINSILSLKEYRGMHISKKTERNKLVKKFPKKNY
jgi:hypothetical protein